MVKFRVKAATILFAFLQTVVWGWGPEERISELERQMLEVSTVTQHGNLGARFASSHALLGCRWLISVDALLWKAKAGESSFAYSVNRPVTEGLTFPQNGNICEIGFDWNWGFKVGVGMETTHNEWELYLQYTRFKSSQSSGSRKDLPAGFLGLTGFLDPALSANSSYKLNYYDLTLSLAKAYFVSSKLMAKPFVGIKNSWINQKQISKYDFDTRSGSLISFTSQLRDSCRFWGIGPLGGFLTQWYLDGGFSILSEVSVALLYGYYKCEDFYRTEESRVQDGETVVSFGNADIKGANHHYSPFTAFQLGLCYERSYNEDKFFFLCKLLYEAQYFFRQEDKITAEGAVRSGATPSLSNSSFVRFIRESEDVSFQGVSLRMEFYF